MQAFSLPQIVVKLIVLFLGIPIHEWAHAWSAYRLGDNTAEQEGRLTLNPVAHLDLVGSLLILVSGFGWGKPVPVDPYRMRRVSPRAGIAITSAAGPLSNFFLAMLCAIPFRLHWLDVYTAWGDWFYNRFTLGALLLIAIQINLGLMVFNLLPFFPLDGEKVLAGVLPDRWTYQLDRFRPFSALFLLLFLFILPRLGIDPIQALITPVMGLLTDLLLWF